MCIRLMMRGMRIFAHLTSSIYKPPTIYKALLLNRVPSFLLTPPEFDLSSTILLIIPVWSM